ncbi:ParB N-terminal domain-containing protein [Candidatus Pelagibacter sp.]|nr:ParB N-terminal domain-containing protein [Candidatus Pelagibacter sp.]
MDKIKKGLGRGLSSLIGETKVEPQKNQLLISDLIPNKFQPRKLFDENNLEDLTNSIRERGMIVPVSKFLISYIFFLKTFVFKFNFSETSVKKLLLW